MAENDKATSTEASVPVVADERGDWFDRWFTDWPRFRFLPELRRSFMEGLEPLRVEEFTEGDQLVVRAEMPGIDPEKDVEITVSDHTLQLRAERREEKKTEEKGRYRSEFQYGSFSRRVELPVGATDKDVKASYKDGILEVRVPIDRERAEAKKIPIERA
jgi:HSP20 family protein